MKMHFVDGPAAGIQIPLRRRPILLRIVHSPAAGWDGLDQLDDSPAPEERVFLYWRKQEGQWCHVDGRDAKTGKRFGRTEWIVDFFHVSDGPTEEILRDNGKYRDWCEENKGRFLRKDAV